MDNVTQPTRDVRTTLHGHWNDVKVLKQCRYNNDDDNEQRFEVWRAGWVTDKFDLDIEGVKPLHIAYKVYTVKSLISEHHRGNGLVSAN